ncbi:hypothetical protein BC936DRAFT_148145 [Jimgerdemannia flammicorona]|uniref:Uncharacterized protein n=1 Tax=Jimgerdemannia flammicorona TaxID=994334 RepID=A0A433D3N8_9FUNG|nr:hypothetical protein BC936DRAFT_148145 [Jimgerdemannia flammicorona]
MSSDIEPYIGCGASSLTFRQPINSAIVSYLKENTKWSYTEFLNLQRDTILLSPPLSDKWNVLDLTWARRFMFKAKELDPNNSKALEKKISAKRAHLIGSINLFSKAAEWNAQELSFDGYSNAFVEQRPDSSYEKLDYVINRDEELSTHVELVRSKRRRLLARNDQAGTKCNKPPQFDPVPLEDEGGSLQSDGDEEDLLIELLGDAAEREDFVEAKKGESELGVEDQDEAISNASKEGEETDDINLGEFTIPSEPGFILKLRKVMDTFKKSTNSVDKTRVFSILIRLAQLGILRLSSRQKIHEPSTMRAEAIRALSEQEKAELKTFTEVPAVMGIPVFEGVGINTYREFSHVGVVGRTVLRSTLNDHWRNLSSTPSTTVERTTFRLHELL